MKWLIYLFVLFAAGAGTIQKSTHEKLPSIRTWMANSNQLTAGGTTKKGTRGGIRTV